MMILRIGIVTISDRSARGERDDASGPVLRQKVMDQGWEVIREKIVPDDFQVIKETLTAWADDGELDLVLTTGGTGFSSRDITPEATQAPSTEPAVAGITSHQIFRDLSFPFFQNVRTEADV